MKFAAHQALVTVAVLIGVGAVGTPTAAHAKLTSAQKCAIAKEAATAKKAAAKIACHTKVKLAAAADPACLQKAEAQFAKAFANAEKPGTCHVNGDAGSIEGRVDAYVTALVQALNPGQAQGQARAATTRAQKCAIAKAKAASKKGSAKLKCHQKNLSLSSVSLLNFCLSIAEGKFDTAFVKAEARGGCATTGDAAAIENLVDGFVDDIAQALPPPTPTLTPAPTPTPAPCTGAFHDNGDGTITDCATTLTWEKKDDAGGIHDKDNVYSWSSTGTAADGTAFTSFLATLNTPPCFAGHCDWRLPTSAGCCGLPTGQAAELESIVDTGVAGCGSGSPCVLAVFNMNCTPGCAAASCSCTVPGYYASATTDGVDPFYAWSVFFYNGGALGFYKGSYGAVRAVR